MLLRTNTGRLGVAAIIALALAYAMLAQGPGWNQNSHYALIRALADHTPKIDQTRYETGTWYPTGDISIYKGHVYSNKAPGLAFAALPAYLVMKAAGGAHAVQFATGQLWFLSLWAVVLPALILLLAVRRVADDFEPGFGTATAVTLGIATLFLPFATLFFSHVLSALLGFGAFAILWYERRGPPRLDYLVLAGLLAGYSITTEFPNAITAGLVGLYALARTDPVRRAVAFGAGAVVGLVPLLIYNQWAFGSPFHLSYQSTVGFGSTNTLFLGAPSFRRAVEVLFAAPGLLRTTPVLALAAIGTVLLYRKGRRLEALLIGALALAYLIFEASYLHPFGGNSPGPRQLVPVLPFLALPLAAMYRRLPLTTLALAAVSAVEMIAVTVSHPTEYFEQYTAWFHQVRVGNFSATVLGLFGAPSLDALKLPSSTNGFVLLVFALPVALAVALAFVVRPSVRVSADDAVTAAVCFAGWIVLQHEGPKLLAGSGPVGHQWAPVTVLLLVAAIGLIAVVLPNLLTPSRAPAEA